MTGQVLSVRSWADVMRDACPWDAEHLRAGRVCAECASRGGPLAFLRARLQPTAALLGMAVALPLLLFVVVFAVEAAVNFVDVAWTASWGQETIDVPGKGQLAIEAWKPETTIYAGADDLLGRPLPLKQNGTVLHHFAKGDPLNVRGRVLVPDDGVWLQVGLEDDTRVFVWAGLTTPISPFASGDGPLAASPPVSIRPAPHAPVAILAPPIVPPAQLLPPQNAPLPAQSVPAQPRPAWCRRQPHWAEVTICASDVLSADDLRVASAYADALARSSQAQQLDLRRAQRAWNRDRSICATSADAVDCLHNRYSARIAALLAYPPPASTEIQAPRQTTATGDAPVSGKPSFIDSTTLQLAGVTVHLSGVIGVGGDAMMSAQLFLGEQGGNLSCTPQGNSRYICKTATGVDLAAAELLNGAARVADGAPSEYYQLQDKARAALKGIWATQ